MRLAHERGFTAGPLKAAAFKPLLKPGEACIGGSRGRTGLDGSLLVEARIGSGGDVWAITSATVADLARDRLVGCQLLQKVLRPLWGKRAAGSGLSRTRATLEASRIGGGGGSLVLRGRLWCPSSKQRRHDAAERSAPG